MKTLIVNEADMPAEVDQAIRKSLCLSFPDGAESFSETRSWHGSAPSYSVIIKENDDVVAHVGIVDRTITAGGTDVRVAGIQNVMVLPSHRGQGLCDIIMQASMDEAAKRDYDAGLLYCVPELEKVYGRCGWKVMPKEEIIRTDANGVDHALPDKNIAMLYPLKVDTLPAGKVQLNGDDW